MKRIRMFACLLLAVVLFTSIPFSVSAEGDDVEVVLLFDVSGSMNRSDPERDGVRLSIEAAYQFVFNYPTKTNMYVTVIPYNSNVYGEFKRVNVVDEKGRTAFSDQMESLMDNAVSGFKCWETNTDTGSALELAKQKLDSSNVAKKAVILFTDGKIELTSKDKLTTAESESKALSSSSAMKDKDIAIYSIGLNCDGKVDKNQLVAISGEKNVRIVNNANDLSGMFTEVYTELFENSRLDDNTDEFTVAPDVESVRKVRIYGQAVREANISLSSGAPLYKIRVETPTGIAVADVDLRKPSDSTIDEDYCLIQSTPSGYSATIKLIEPMDGDWTIAVTGEKSTVITRKIYLFDLEANTDISANEHYIGDDLKYTAAVYNSESKTHLTSTGLYAAEDGGKASVSVARKGVNGQALYPGELNASQNGYLFSVKFDALGEYTLTTTLTHEQFEASTENTIKVVGPKVKIDAIMDGGKYKINTSFVHPKDSSALKALPQYFLSDKMTVSIMCDGKQVDTVDANVSDLSDGKYSLEFSPAASGKYEVVVKLSSGGEYKSEAVDYKAPEKPLVEIKVDDKFPDDISKRGFAGSFEKELSLNGAFELVNSDDNLTYSVKVEGDDSFTAEVSGDVLKIKSTGFGEAKLILTVSGGGVSYDHEIELASKSFWPIIIIIFVVIILLIAATIIAIIVVRKKSIISIAFKFKIEDRSRNVFTPAYAVYEVTRLSNKKNAKPAMTIAQIVNANGYAQMEMGATMNPQEVDAFMAQYANGITLKGVPFKKAFKITYRSADGKTRNATFTKTNVVVRLSDTCDITFGNSHANF